MKLAVVVLVLLPFALAASVDHKRFIESLLGGYDIVGLAKQLLSQFGTDETEQQCENQFCPELVDKIDGHNTLITHIICAAVCKEAQVLSSHYLSTVPPIGGK
ncbi:uncharacterized protein LOC127868493 isoform X2 [Dreissena polymorpha]|uniref:Uncharacterized protein n=2 Tax=Dreissena polymorpha TaxID=45954 RepID=A0A9D4RM57_DREPO|nr:uncharacterized protein LOC127868493 isoform X2 [Dreissena polymorpha]KAH3871412.1 hypothetical protein DPMN_034612 [Dreissena polymorpha]